MKKSIKIILIILALILAIIIGINIYKYSSKKLEINRLPLYYRDLAEQCLQKTWYECCMSSVHNMKYGNYKLSENGTCPDGFKAEMVKCPDSFEWCEPIKQ